ncbi:hypothetical protein [Sphaerochaeta halotolerans]|uniref:hypothetical protein n=1 Tax=Sphaerochaeta halotolerans TaxID=2293840 RepID=UPI0014022EC1|nr:hypothetical protein [Sphaerochaeta halotolerans]
MKRSASLTGAEKPLLHMSFASFSLEMIPYAGISPELSVAVAYEKVQYVWTQAIEA